MLSSLIGVVRNANGAENKNNNNTKDGFHRWAGNVEEQLSEVLELCACVAVQLAAVCDGCCHQSKCRICVFISNNV